MYKTFSRRHLLTSAYISTVFGLVGNTIMHERLFSSENSAAYKAGSAQPGLDLPKTCLDMPTRSNRLAGLRKKFWPVGRTLQVRFLDGDPSVQAKVEEVAHEWSEYANLHFEFGDANDAEIRISFTQSGSWSYLGTDALTIAHNAPTMNYGWLTSNTPDSEYKRVVLHEFGHAIGLIHEHESPSANIPWDKPVVYQYYQGPPNNWTKAQVDVNLFTVYSADSTQFSQFDRTSIMLYPIPEAFTVGDYEVGWNTELSDTDKAYIEQWYPYDPPRPTRTPTQPPTETPAPTSTSTVTPTSTQTPTSTPTNTPTPTSTSTATPTSTQTPTSTPTNTPTNTSVPTPTPTAPPSIPGDSQRGDMNIYLPLIQR